MTSSDPLRDMRARAEDAITEATLNRMGIRWERLDVPLSEIDFEASRHNNARLTADGLGDEDTILVYSEAMEMGAIFPAAIGYRNKKSKIVLTAGNLRTTAADMAHLTSFPIYVMDNPTRLQILDLTATNNTQHGLPLDYNERLAHAAQYVAEGSTQTAACQKFNVKGSRLGSYIRQQASRNRLIALRIGEPKDKMKLDRMYAIKSDVVLAAAAKVANSMSTDEFDELVTAINRARSEAAQLQVIAATVARQSDERKVLPVITTSTRVMSTYDRVWKYAKSSEKLPSIDRIEEIDIHLVPHLREQLERAVSRLQEILDHLP